MLKGKFTVKYLNNSLNSSNQVKFTVVKEHVMYFVHNNATSYRALLLLMSHVTDKRSFKRQSAEGRFCCPY